MRKTHENDALLEVNKRMMAAEQRIEVGSQ